MLNTNARHTNHCNLHYNVRIGRVCISGTYVLQPVYYMLIGMLKLYDP